MEELILKVKKVKEAAYILSYVSTNEKNKALN